MKSLRPVLPKLCVDEYWRSEQRFQVFFERGTSILYRPPVCQRHVRGGVSLLEVRSTLLAKFSWASQEYSHLITVHLKGLFDNSILQDNLETILSCEKLGFFKREHLISIGCVEVVSNKIEYEEKMYR